MQKVLYTIEKKILNIIYHFNFRLFLSFLMLPGLKNVWTISQRQWGRRCIFHLRSIKRQKTSLSSKFLHNFYPYWKVEDLSPIYQPTTEKILLNTDFYIQIMWHPPGANDSTEFPGRHLSHILSTFDAVSFRCETVVCSMFCVGPP